MFSLAIVFDWFEFKTIRNWLELNVRKHYHTNMPCMDVNFAAKPPNEMWHAIIVFNTIPLLKYNKSELDNDNNVVNTGTTYNLSGRLARFFIFSTSISRIIPFNCLRFKKNAANQLMVTIWANVFKLYSWNYFQSNKMRKKLKWLYNACASYSPLWMKIEKKSRCDSNGKIMI